MSVLLQFPSGLVIKRTSKGVAATAAALKPTNISQLMRDLQRLERVRPTAVIAVHEFVLRTLLETPKRPSASSSRSNEMISLSPNVLDLMQQLQRVDPLALVSIRRFAEECCASRK